MSLDKHPFPKAIYINKEVEFGEIYLVRDSLISFPETDRVEGQRTEHDTDRRVVIVQNNTSNYSMEPTVLIAPLTHRTDLKRLHDIELFNKDESAITKDVLVKLQHIQPILRADLGEYTGEISDTKQAEIMQGILEIFGQDQDD